MARWRTPSAWGPALVGRLHVAERPLAAAAGAQGTGAAEPLVGVCVRVRDGRPGLRDGPHLLGRQRRVRL